jgi:hypothetical protein
MQPTEVDKRTGRRAVWQQMREPRVYLQDTHSHRPAPGEGEQLDLPA